MEETFFKFKCTKPNCKFGCMSEKVLANHYIEHQRIEEKLAKGLKDQEDD